MTPRDVRRMADVRRRPIRVWNLVDVELAIGRRQAPPGIDQHAVAAALGKSSQSIRNPPEHLPHLRPEHPFRRIQR